MNLTANEKELVSILSQAKDQLKAIDREIIETEANVSEIAEDLEKLKSSLKAVDSELNSRIQKMNQAEENHGEIKLFYEKIMQNTKNLTMFINKQNTSLESGN